jgi:hypothetical protein
MPAVHIAYVIRKTYLSLTNDKNDKDLCAYKKDIFLSNTLKFAIVHYCLKCAACLPKSFLYFVKCEFRDIYFRENVPFLVDFLDFSHYFAQLSFKHFFAAFYALLREMSVSNKFR